MSTRLFLLGNGAPPKCVATLLVGLNLVPDAKRRRDAWDAFRAFRDGTLPASAFYWRMEENAQVRVHGEKSWCRGGVPPGMRGSDFWADAQSALA